MPPPGNGAAQQGFDGIAPCLSLHSEVAENKLTFRISSFGLLMRRIRDSGAPSSSRSSRPLSQQEMRYTAITTRCCVSRCSILDMSRSVLTKDLVMIWRVYSLQCSRCETGIEEMAFSNWAMGFETVPQSRGAKFSYP